MNKTQMLQLLDTKVCQCTRCPNFAARTKTVFGEGNVNTKILFLGEGPGADEDASGRPFVGRAGKLLEELIGVQGWKREDVYICNIVKCRPPANRKPTDEESANCRGFLDLQIKIVNPDIIVCLGATAAQNLLQTQNTVSSLRKSWYHYANAKVRVTYHPAYLLRNMADRWKVDEDLETVANELRDTANGPWKLEQSVAQ